MPNFTIADKGEKRIKGRCLEICFRGPVEGAAHMLRNSNEDEDEW
jgi:hypothetical protein